MSLKTIKTLLESVTANAVSGLNSGVDPYKLSKTKWFKTEKQGGAYGNSASKEYMEKSNAGISEEVLNELEQPYSSEYKWRGHVHARHGMDIDFQNDKRTGKILATKGTVHVGEFKYRNKTPLDTAGIGFVRDTSTIANEAWVPKEGQMVLSYGKGEHSGKTGKVIASNPESTTIRQYNDNEFTVPTSTVCLDESVINETIIRKGGDKAAYNVGFAHGQSGGKKLENPENSFGRHADHYHQGYKDGSSSEKHPVGSTVTIHPTHKDGKEQKVKIVGKDGDHFDAEYHDWLGAKKVMKLHKNFIKEEHMFKDIYESMNEEANLGDWIKSFQNSKDNRFYSKSYDERANLAIIGFFENASNNGIELTEELIDEQFSTIKPNQLDEVNKTVSKMVIKKVVKKAAEQALDPENNK